MNKWFTCLAVVFVTTTALTGQSTFYRWGIGVSPSIYSFYALDSGFFKSNAYEWGVQFSAMRYLNASFDGGLEAGLGVVRHPDWENYRQIDSLRSRQRDNFYTMGLGFRYKFDNGYLLKKDALFSPFLRSGISANYNMLNWHAHVPLGAGLNIRLNKIAANIVLQSSYNLGIDAPSFLQHSLGLNLNFGHHAGMDLSKAAPINDRDYDGLPDESDQCPDAFGPARAKGCPDADNDGIRDTEDKCPDQSGYANLMGCLDSDYDGIIDPDDQCPTVYGETQTGCPPPKPVDADKDGVPDDKDLCPGLKGFFTAQGCPDVDGDGIRDEEDKCPERYGVKEYNGCPKSPLEMKAWEEYYKNGGKAPNAADLIGANNTQNGNLPIGAKTPLADIDERLADDEYCKRVALADLGRAYFEVAAQKPQGSSYAEINKVVNVMKRCANYNITLEGHADADGSAASNDALSKRRAENVQRYMTQQGISVQRIKVQFYGESQPAAPNDNSENKQKNRRVEFEMNRGF